MEKEIERERNGRNFSLLSTLLSVFDTSDSEDIDYVISKYLLEHFYDLKKININDIADECFTSRSSVQRFIKMIGFKNIGSLKDTLKETYDHAQIYTNFGKGTDFKNRFKTNFNEMIDDVSAVYDDQDMGDLIKRIYDAKEVCIICADNSSSAGREFQHVMMGLGKVIHLITNSSSNWEHLNHLNETDLVIVVSVTGNYATCLEKELKEVKANKVLITLNIAKEFFNTYQQIYYLSQRSHLYNHGYIAIGVYDIYTKYGPQYFFDLLYNHYLSTYYSK